MTSQPASVLNSLSLHTWRCGMRRTCFRCEQAVTDDSVECGFCGIFIGDSVFRPRQIGSGKENKNSKRRDASISNRYASRNNSPTARAAHKAPTNRETLGKRQTPAKPNSTGNGELHTSSRPAASRCIRCGAPVTLARRRGVTLACSLACCIRCGAPVTLALQCPTCQNQVWSALKGRFRWNR